ncbi:Arylsulfatase [Rosistilla carotiformis]|uniref:Arylsulfatase n=1 Tax=Rosistilla carotiformis TaxID=2528017 RepID=A0A518JUN1_9BACT|nr:sulfatase-like hydrolase/transferase [Rosistilla carotiformis]QDV69253.1 Arylsulfatase [Rosistilla carotiformis]
MKYLIACCVTFTLALATTPVFAESVPTPKGIVFVLVDDIGYGDIDVLYPSVLETPNIDALYRESLRLTDFHVGSTCAPSRGSIMTGRAINAGGVWHTIAGRELLRENEQTMAEVFRANGWRTAIFGKWHLGDGYPYSPRFRGFDLAVVHGGGGVGQGPDYWMNDYYSDVDFDGKPTAADVYWENGKTFEADKFCTDYWFDRSKEFIKQSVAEGKRFFCYLPTNAAHSPFNAPHGFKKGFDGLIENVDENMGRMDEFLAAEGIQDDVLVIFSTDNGTTGSRLGGLRQRKGSHYDGGHNVPCFWRWKKGGIGGSSESARDVASLTAGMDLLPTFMDLWGLKRPDGGLPLHGISLKEMLLSDDYTPQQRTLIIDTQREADLVKWRRACVLRDEVEEGKITHKWRLIQGKPKSKQELYDFLVDRDTNDNIIEGNDATVASLAASYDAWWDDVSAGWEAFPPFVVDDRKEPELTLYAHSWIGTSMTPWNQSHIVQGAAGTGTHSIRFDSSGRYQIELRRWPREDGGAIAGKSSTGAGKVIPATKARVALGKVGEATKAINPQDDAVVFEMEVPAGEATTLTTALLDDDDKVLNGAFYVYIKKTADDGDKK